MRTVRPVTFGLALVVTLVGGASVSAQDVPRAKATIRSCTDGSVVGSATLLETPSAEAVKNVTVLVSARNLPPGKHAVHIHEVGACTPCSAAGSHLDIGLFGNNLPVTANHPHHSGDLINLRVGSSGSGFMTHVSSRVAVSDGTLSIFDLDGASVIIHALPDTYCANPNDPNCAGGARAACGVLERVK